MFPDTDVCHTGLLPPASAVEFIETDRSVCLSDCQLALSWLNRLMYGHDI